MRRYSAAFLFLVLSIAVLSSLKPAHGFLFPIAQRNELRGTPRPIGSIWPRPYLHHQETNYFEVDTANFVIEVVDDRTKARADCPLLNYATEHYTNLIRNLNSIGNGSNGTRDRNSKAGGPSRLIVELYQCTDYPESLEANYETYNIESRDHGPDGIIATVDANSPQSVIRALESLYQMLWPAVSSDGIVVYNINATYIVDSPRFPHRGLMLDSSRHFLTEKILTKILTGMMYNKLNVFHWHIIDDQSFAFQSRRFPELSEKGAYHKNAVFTPEAVQRVIEAARVRGIRTILEFDTPGHAGGIGFSHPELLTPCYGDGVNPGTPDPARFAAYENLDPSNEDLYPFMRELFTEIVQNVTRDPYIHLGMDEVYPDCWESSPEIRKFMEKNNYTRIAQVQEHYTTRHVAMVKSLGAKMIAWQDPVDDGVELDKDVVIQVWKDWEARDFDNTYKKILDKGYNVLLSACWYINYISYGESWRKYYECDPYLNGAVPENQRSQVLGGEAAIWAEFVDPTNIIPRIFPFVGAIGSALWDTNIDSSEGRENTDDAMFRLDVFRCSLLQRGIAAQPIYNGYCGDFETEVDFS